jgi:WD40 repeat protein
MGHTKRVTSLFMMNNLLVSGSYDSTIRTWNIQVF